MLHLFIRSVSTSTTAAPKAAANWRNQVKQSQLVSQISSILLQRLNWGPLLKTLNLSSKITPSLFLQILHRTQTNPQISLSFFNWAKKYLGFQPDLKVQCKLAHILIRVGLSQPARPILDSLIQAHPPTQIVESLICSCRGTDSQSLVFSSVVECYCAKGLYLQALEVSQKAKDLGHVILVHGCYALLGCLHDRNEIQLAYCFCAWMFRNGALMSQSTWSIIAQVLYKDGKFERIVKIKDMGICNSVMYNLLIDGYSEGGNFKAAFDNLNEMCNRKLDPCFGTYCSILDGACKFEDVEVIKLIMDDYLVEMGHIPEDLLSECDLVIQKLSDMGKTYAAEMVFKRASVEKIELQDASYGCMLRAFAKEGKVKKAIEMYCIMLGRGTVVNDSCYYAFVNAICNEYPSEEISELLADMIRRGFIPFSAELSNYMTSLCDKRRWREAEELLNVIIDKGVLPDSFCCSSLVSHYCSSRRVDSAVALHTKMKELEGVLDAETYNILLNGLLKERRAEEALEVFDYVRRRNLLSSASFSIMISGLCRENELRKAMRLHDEMLKMGLKPDGKTYKRLIASFR
ncbi:hypothetical protein RJ639_032572 [Escallonia herrerae]|uniref:Pentatricopeptide repeat-containing protein n=1 Tax=Escallonia herrerae TaxID=1293975 RepID=A0AA89BAZ0_9ASTE|nr:hypothetical protein RJ639_032572 [Escallonia herrerae]